MRSARGIPRRENLKKNKNSNSDSTMMIHEIEKTNASLKDLDKSPIFRGTVDAIEGEAISGWVLSTKSPIRPVELEVWLAGVRAAVITTSLPRSDISQLVGFPVKCGFQFRTSSICAETSKDIIRKLKLIDGDSISADEVISIRIPKDNIVLALSPFIDPCEVFIEGLIGGLESVLMKPSANVRMSMIDDLLENRPLEWDSEKDSVDVVAYYLPQFHPLKENNEWWGTGFTEWTNVVSAKPFFSGHYQPHQPADLGFYDLRLDQVHRDQIALAKQYGLRGFCYYYYWFSGKSIMTLPIDRHVEQDLDLDFCLCWANESWSRRWDGSEKDVLIQQRHTYESDVEFIHSCIPYFRSSRYIKINGAPLLQVYRISLLENALETLNRWREIVRAEGFPDLHVSMVESFGLSDPIEYGCDSSCQFPPHGVLGNRSNLEVEGLEPSFTGTIYSYGEIVREELAKPRSQHSRFRSAMPSWDNTARKGSAGNVFAGARPALFETWMRYLVADARQRLPEGQRFVFVNAWNEWAEGTHLEPDRKFGHANLRAVRNSLASDAKALAPLLPPIDGTEDSLAETRRYMVSLIAANRELTKLIRRDKYDLRLGEEQLLVPCPVKMLKVSAQNDGRLNLDSVNGRHWNDGPPLPLSQKGALSLHGWLVLPGHETDVTFLSLVGCKNERYIAQLHRRAARTDVVEALELDQSSLNCGFSISVGLQNLQPGKYHVEFLIADFRRPDNALAVGSSLSILIGGQ